MLGSNTENALQIIDKIITVSASINVSAVSYQMTHTLISSAVSGSTASSGGDGGHSHGAGSLHVNNPQSREDPRPGIIQNVSLLKPLKSDFDAFINRVQLIDKNIYVKNTEMHNSIGSPYTELYRLQSALNDVIFFSRSCNYMGEYVAGCVEALRLLNRAMQVAVDAKWATIMYGDYLERGYNHVLGQNPDTTK